MFVTVSKLTQRSPVESVRFWYQLLTLRSAPLWVRSLTVGRVAGELGRVGVILWCLVRECQYRLMWTTMTRQQQKMHRCKLWRNMSCQRRKLSKQCSKCSCLHGWSGIWSQNLKDNFHKNSYHANSTSEIITIKSRNNILQKSSMKLET